MFWALEFDLKKEFQSAVVKFLFVKLINLFFKPSQKMKQKIPGQRNRTMVRKYFP